MRVLILGGTGMLGHKLVQVLGASFETWFTVRGTFPAHYAGILPADRVFEHVSAFETAALEKIFVNLKPDVVINAIGITKQAPEAADIVGTLTVNSIFPHKVSKIANELGIRFITISTDCVFLGTKGNYAETDIPDALDLYGRSKQFGEVDADNSLTLRTSIIGRELSASHGLIEWFLGQKGRAKGFANAVFSGFPTRAIAEIIGDVIEQHPSLSGIYHLSSEPINKFDLLDLVKRRLSLTIELERSEHPRIDRSLDSSLFRQITGFRPVGWEQMVDAMFADETAYKQIREAA